MSGATLTALVALSALATLVFLGTVAVLLNRISGVLEAVGGRGDSTLTKLRLGLNAIERETSHLPAAAVPLNDHLGQVAGGLAAVDGALGALHDALRDQEAR